MKTWIKKTFSGENKRTNIMALCIGVSLFFIGYNSAHYEEKGNDPPVSQKSTEVASWYKGDIKYSQRINEFEKFMNYTATNSEEFKDWHMVWTAYDERTPVVMIDFENLAKVNNISVADAEKVVRDNVKLFGKYLQMFNNKVHDGKMKQGELTLVVLNNKGQEITMTQIMTPVSLTN